MFPYIYYGIAAWCQATHDYLRNIFILQKRDLRLMSFAGSGSHAIPFVYFIILRVSLRNLLVRATCVVVPLELAMSSSLVWLFW